jgi:hypothetical protein
MTSVSVGPIVSQGTPSRYFVMDPIKSVDEFRNLRDAALGLLVGKIQEVGGLPANYDVRPVSPLDDFNLFQSTAVASAYAADWSIVAASLTNVTASLSSAGNAIVNGTMPQNRFLTLYGTELQTQGTPPEVMWKFASQANVKSIWFVQDLLGFDYPRASTRQVPVWGPSEISQHYVYVVASQPVTDVHLSLWAEPVGTTITAANLKP